MPLEQILIHPFVFSFALHSSLLNCSGSVILLLNLRWSPKPRAHITAAFVSFFLIASYWGLSLPPPSSPFVFLPTPYGLPCSSLFVGLLSAYIPFKTPLCCFTPKPNPTRNDHLISCVLRRSKLP